MATFDWLWNEVREYKKKTKTLKENEQREEEAEKREWKGNEANALFTKAKKYRPFASLLK